MNLDLTGQVVCVTGGSEGIGLATAQAFANEGAHVVICGRRQSKLDEAVASHATAKGGTIEAVQADMTKLADIDRLIAHIQARLDQVAQLQQAHPQPVRPGLWPIHVATNGQVVQNAVCSGRVKPRFFADFFQ